MTDLKLNRVFDAHIVNYNNQCGIDVVDFFRPLKIMSTIGTNSLFQSDIKCFVLIGAYKMHSSILVLYLISTTYTHGPWLISLSCFESAEFCPYQHNLHSFYIQCMTIQVKKGKPMIGWWCFQICILFHFTMKIVCLKITHDFMWFHVVFAKEKQGLNPYILLNWYHW